MEEEDGTTEARTLENSIGTVSLVFFRAATSTVQGFAACRFYGSIVYTVEYTLL